MAMERLQKQVALRCPCDQPWHLVIRLEKLSCVGMRYKSPIYMGFQTQTDGGRMSGDV